MEAVASREPTLLLHLSPYKANPFSRPLIRRSKLLASWMTWYFKRSYIAGTKRTRTTVLFEFLIRLLNLQRYIVCGKQKKQTFQILRTWNVITGSTPVKNHNHTLSTMKSTLSLLLSSMRDTFFKKWEKKKPRHRISLQRLNFDTFITFIASSDMEPICLGRNGAFLSQN